MAPDMLLSVPTFVHRLLQRLLKTLTDKLDKDYQLAKTDLRRLVGAAASAGFCPPCPFCLLCFNRHRFALEDLAPKLCRPLPAAAGR